MTKKYQVFVSSTYEDLKEERNAVYGTLLRNDCIPCGMELFEAGNASQWETITKTIDLCDYYILIVAHRYGSLSSEGISYTEKEYRYALDSGIPLAAMIIDNDAPWPESKRDGGDNKHDLQKKLDNFKAFAKKDKMVRFWKNTGELESACAGAIRGLIKDHPRSGWIHGSILDTDSPTRGGTIQTTKLSAKEQRARESILVGALSGPDGNYIGLDLKQLNHVIIDNYSYNDTEEQRLLYIETVEHLIQERLVKHISGLQNELTAKGFKLAQELRSKGITPDKPNP